MDSAIGKVKSLMADFGLTIEHLTQSVAGKSAAKKSKVAKKRAASAAKYADPKTGKTWSGFGRAPGWIAGAKNRDAFLVNKSTAPTAEAAPVESERKVAAKKAVKAAVAPAKKAKKAVAKKVVPVSKKATSKKAAPGKKSAAKKAAAANPVSATGGATPAAE